MNEKRSIVETSKRDPQLSTSFTLNSLNHICVPPIQRMGAKTPIPRAAKTFQNLVAFAPLRLCVKSFLQFSSVFFGFLHKSLNHICLQPPIQRKGAKTQTLRAAKTFQDLCALAPLRLCVKSLLDDPSSHQIRVNPVKSGSKKIKNTTSLPAPLAAPASRRPVFLI